MGIITKEVEIKPTGKMIQYYKDKGYDVKYGQSLIIKIEDLSKGSHLKIDVLCDMCHKNKMTVKYETYNRVVRETGSYVCKECSQEKRYRTNQKKYGVSIASKSNIVKEKMKQTNLKIYGVDNYGKTKECRDKIKETCLEKYHTEHFAKTTEIKNKKAKTNLKRYGFEHILQVREFKEKVSNTNLERYGAKSPLSNSKVQEKIKQTNLKKYGVLYPMQSLEIRERASKTLYGKSAVLTSKQQLYIFNLYNKNKIAELNYPISYYNVDICFLEEKLTIEYDGGFHNGQVKLGQMTQEEFDRKEIIRNNTIKREGYKQMRIISLNDKLPSDQVLLEMLDNARNYFIQYPNHSWIEYNISTSTIRNAEHKDGIPYSYGELRTIKEIA